jgi:hypothetical protein
MTNDPVLVAYIIKRSKSGKTIRKEIGRAYPHEEGAGLTVVLDVLPLGKQIVLLEPDAE